MATAAPMSSIPPQQGQVKRFFSSSLTTHEEFRRHCKIECGARQIKVAGSRARVTGDVAAFSRPRRRSRADPPSLRSGENWHSGDAALRQRAWAQGTSEADHLGAARSEEHTSELQS